VKRIFLILLLSGFLMGCGHNPKKDIVMKGYSSSGPYLIVIEKGALDEGNRGKSWQYLDELKKGEYKRWTGKHSEVR